MENLVLTLNCLLSSSINPLSNTINWEAEANYACPTVVHHPPNTNYVQIAEDLLQTTSPTTILQHSQSTTTTTSRLSMNRLHC